MKKIILIFAGMMTLFFSSCDDMLDVDGGSDLEEPELTSKTDSLFYVAGILEAMQHAAEVYVIQNEMRGDLTTTTSYTNSNLQALADFSADTSNKYDSAYVFYKIVNNCNYYLAHRDTTLYDGSTNTTLTEYGAVLSFRAWAYLQLARIYGEVKFFTEPLTTLSQIEDDDSPEYGLEDIVLNLESQLLEFADYNLPYAGSISDIGTDNVYLERCCIPIYIVLGDMYLEVGRYEDAAQCYYNFLYSKAVLAQDWRAAYSNNDISMPTDFDAPSNDTWYDNCCSNISTDITTYDIITYIPFAETSLQGYTSELPSLFGYNWYYNNSHDSPEQDSVYLEEIQIVASDAYYDLADSADYYYQTNDAVDPQKSVIEGAGDMRAQARLETIMRDNKSEEYFKLYTDLRVILYRGTTVWLHLAEALNRMGYPDAAFAVLKDGITDDLLDYGYIRDETKELLTTTLPFLSYSGTSEQSVVFSGSSDYNHGIHRHGCSDQYGLSTELSLYTYSDIVGEKLAKIGEEYGLELTDSANNTLQDTINAVEDLLCDEYAMEFAFEGTRFADLARLARNKNGNGSATYTGTPSKYGTNFGGTWLYNKLKFKTSKDLTNEENWYLPMK